jgi:protein-tyrosine phosphatase
MLPQEPPPPVIDFNWASIGNGRLSLWHRPAKKAILQLGNLGCTWVLTLMCAREGALDIGRQVNQVGLKWIYSPLENGKPPQGEAAESIKRILPILSLGLDEGQSILIHCSAGIHRTGMVAYTLLRLRGYTQEEALSLINQMRQQTREGIRNDHIKWGNEVIQNHQLH